MNKVFDYGGALVSTSKPTKSLTTLKKTIYIDSGDRETTTSQYNGDFIVFLPRVYERVVSITVKTAEFPKSDNLLYYSQGITGSDIGVGGPSANSPLYYLLEIDGLNKSDETTKKSYTVTQVDSVFAKFQNIDSTKPSFYTENSSQQIIQRYYPSIGKLDRLRLKLRVHGFPGFVYWPTEEYGITLEIETLENSFDDFSSMETRLRH
jgi:hypothetical protein